MQADDVVQRSPNALTADVGDELVALDPTSGTYFALAGPAPRIWSLIAQPITVAAVCDALMRDYDVERGTCEADVLDFIGRLSELGLVDRRERERENARA